jgi:hypothetical protein
LSTRYGFAPGSIQMLIDQEATRQGILAALTRLQQETKLDDTVYVHFSGYGSLIKLYQADGKEPLFEKRSCRTTAGRAPRRICLWTTFRSRSIQ